ncbi:MAG: exo-alpha-sialidase [Saprospiraceae bacterium]
MKKYQLLAFLSFLFWKLSAQDISEGQLIFDLQTEHTHGSTIVALPNGDLLAAWFQGNGERWADDVRIMGSRRKKGKQQWSQPFLMADVPDFPDINPVLFLDTRGKLWLVWYTVMANQWETSLLKYRISENFMQQEGAPEWQWQDVLHVKPGGPTERGIQADDAFVQSVQSQLDQISTQLLQQGTNMEALEEWIKFKTDILAKAKGENMMRGGRVPNQDGSYTNQSLGYPYFRRMGWQTKNKAIFVGDRMILPLYSDGLEMSLFAITDDFGAHWRFSTPVVGIANIQASIAQKKDGTLVAYMRDNGPPPYRHPVSSSSDQGLTWSPVQDSELPNPGSGSDIVTLANGHWVIAYNDTEKGRHSLALSLSTDEGKTWSYTRHLLLSNQQEKPATGAYPSIIQGSDGTIHVVYSFKPAGASTETIKYFECQEDWIKKGDQ